MRTTLLLLAVLIVAPIAAMAEQNADVCRPGFWVSEENAWQELLNDRDTYRLTDPVFAVPYINSIGHDEMEIGREGAYSVACLPPQILEPTTIMLLGAGLIGLGIAGRRCR